MRADLFARLRQIMRGGSLPKSPVTPETPVTGPSGYRSKPQELQALQPLQVENRKLEKRVFSPATSPVPLAPEVDEAAILERAGLCADSVPAIYLDAWAQLNCIMPLRVSEAEWRQALDDGGRFLDEWGWVCGSGLEWSAGELFDIPSAAIGDGGLIWRLGGALVEVYGPDHVRLSDGRTIKRGIFEGTPPATKKPDLDKLERTVNDALKSAGCITDESCIVRTIKTKRLAEIGEAPGLRLKLEGAE